MSIALDEIRRKNQKRKTLKGQYRSEAERFVADYDDEALKKKNKALAQVKAEISMANAGVERDIDYLDKGCLALAGLLLKEKGIERPEKGSPPEKVSDYYKQRDETVDQALAVVYSEMSDESKPFGFVELADGSQQKTVDGAIVEAVAEKQKPKGKKAGNVTVKKLDDDGSEAEAASEVVEKPADSIEDEPAPPAKTKPIDLKAGDKKLKAVK